MRRIFLTILISAAMAFPAAAQQPPQPPPGFNTNTPLVTKPQGEVIVNGRSVPLSTVTQQDMGYFIPDGKGGLIWNPSGQPRPALDPNYLDAREVKLQVRELAEQLLANIQQVELRGKIALPTSFVNQDNFEQSSAFGRYIAEQMFHEFNQRGFQVREYRLSGQKINMGEGVGDLYLSREKGEVTATDSANVILVGTYYHDGMNLFINARLIRPSDGYVYRTAQMVMPITDTTRTMLARTGRRLESGNMQIVSKEWTVEQAAEKQGRKSPGSGVQGGGSAVDSGGAGSAVDQGFDVH